MNNLRLGITGSPGTGKKSVANELSRLTGLEVLSLNEISIRNKLGKWTNGEFVVDLQRLRRQRLSTRGKIIVGHLLPYVVPSSQLDFVVILRCSPTVLRKRYIERGYPKPKIEQNILAELLDLVSFAALRRYGRLKVSEFDTTHSKNPRTVTRRILATIDGKRPKHYGSTNWARNVARSHHRLLRIMRT
jgi:adenylate kinase